MNILKKYWLLSTGCSSNPEWLYNYAGATCAAPTSIPGEYRIYITGRDNANRSIIGYAHWNVDQPGILYNFSEAPVLKLGAEGSFYESGTSYPNVFMYENECYLIFTGWIRGVTVPFYNNIGIARLCNKMGQFICESPFPLLPYSEDICLGTGSSCIKLNKGMYELYFTNFDSWFHADGKLYHKYSLRKQSSACPLRWTEKSRKLSTTLSNHIENICKPSFLDDVFLFCGRARDSDYSLYYGTMDATTNCVSNVNKVEFGEFSEIGRDNLGQSYPTGISERGRKFIIYSGNDYGSTGLGMIEV